ncbi:conjugal transfer protein TrbG [Burkholderiales bacterium GJ-E10]|nr:conjugal transfer protein TrbG [Burkholderiales bacterium GJ-E10]
MSKNPIKTAIAALALAAAATASAGTIVDEVGTPDPLTSHEIYALKSPIPLSERATSVAAQTWLKTGYAPSMLGTNGQVMYAYGQSQPTITCAPLHICVINLLLGEHITNLSIGDSVRWMVQTADAGHTPVVVVKPVAAGLTTNLVVTTDAGRVYYMTLVSRQHRYVPQIGFYDPQQIVIRLQRQADAQAAQDGAKKQSVVAQIGRVDPSDLDFDYHCAGDDPDEIDRDLLPVRVFAGGGHTYLQMQDGMSFRDAPAVFRFDGGKTELINSRLVNNYFVIDGLPEHFKLVVGVGKGARTVSCGQGAAPKPFAIPRSNFLPQGR